MKPFVVEKNSWHYRLNAYALDKGVFDTKERVDMFIRSKDNLCSYWRLTIFSIIKLAAIGVFIGGAIFIAGAGVYTLGKAIFMYPLEGLIIIVVVFSAIFVCGLIGYALSVLAERRRKKLYKILHEGHTETSLTKAKYDSWKAGVCVPVEFKE
jgi:hypothetical protein